MHLVHGAYALLPHVLFVFLPVLATQNVHHRLQGIGGWGGGLSEYIALDTRYVHLLPEGIPRKLIVNYYQVSTLKLIDQLMLEPLLNLLR